MQKRHYYIISLLSLMILMAISPPVIASTGVPIYLDGQRLVLGPQDVPPVIINGRTMVPVRIISEELGADVTWISNEQPVLIRQGATRVELTLGQKIAYLDGAAVELDAPPVLIQSRIMVPLRFIGQSFGAGVEWDNASRSVHITSAIGELSEPGLTVTEGRASALVLRSSRRLVLESSSFLPEEGTFTVNLSRVTAEELTQEIESAPLERLEIHPLEDNSLQVVLHFDDAAASLVPQAVLSDDEEQLTISWPIGLKQAAFSQSGAIEHFSFGLPLSVVPELIDTTEEVEAGGSLPGRVNAEVGVNLRPTPSTAQDKICTVPYLTEVEVVGETTGWYQVRLADGQEGWMTDEWVTVTTEIEEKVGVNVRSTPEVKRDNSNRITTLYPGHKVVVLKRENGWCRVDFGGKQPGWIREDLVPIGSRLTQPVTISGLRIVFPQVVRDSELSGPWAESIYIETAQWIEAESELALELRLKKPINSHLLQDENGWRLMLGTLVEDISLSQASGGTTLRVRLQGQSRPTARYVASEQALLVTIPGAGMSSELPTHLQGVGGLVQAVEATQLGDEVRLTIRLREQSAYHLNAVNGNEVWEIKIASPSLVGKTIALDPGHGATDPGAMGTKGWNEKDFTHDIAYRLRELLVSAGANVVMTREVNSPYIDAPRRAALINQANVDAFLSIHINSYSKRDVRGLETFYYPRYENERFARLVHGELVDELGWPDRGVIPNTRYLIIKETHTTGALAEIGFISNATEEALLLQESVRIRIAEALFRAIERYF